MDEIEKEKYGWEMRTTNGVKFLMVGGPLGPVLCRHTELSWKRRGRLRQIVMRCIPWRIPAASRASGRVRTSMIVPVKIVRDRWVLTRMIVTSREMRMSLVTVRSTGIRIHSRKGGDYIMH